MSEFEDAKDKVMMGAERKSMLMTEDEKRMTAYHEAGHAIVAMHEPASDPIHKATIIPRGRALGMVMRLPERDQNSMHRDQMYAHLSIAMGGRVAEELIFGYDRVSSGASSDIQSATRLARSMVTRWGMSEAVGPLEYAEDEQNYLGYGMARPAHMSDETARLIDSEIKKLVEGGLNRAKQVLSDHIDQLHSLAQALLEYETLTGEEIKRLIAGEDMGREDPGTKAAPVASAGTSIPKIRKPKGPFGNPAPQGA
jgi:cell division protease FtsH